MGWGNFDLERDLAQFLAAGGVEDNGRSRFGCLGGGGSLEAGHGYADATIGADYRWASRSIRQLDGDGSQLLARGHIPGVHGLGVFRHNLLAVWAEGYGSYRLRVAEVGADLLAVGQVYKLQ